MRKIVLIVSLLCSVLIIAQDAAPKWYNEELRVLIYPRTDYVIGFIVGEIQQGESVEQTHQRLKEKAQAEAVGNILTTVEHTSLSNVQSTQISGTSGFSEIVKEDFKTNTTIYAAVKDIPNLSVESWQKPNTNEVYAFAWVKKSTISTTLQKRIISLMTRAEISLENAERMYSNGEKIMAREQLEECAKYIQQVEQCQKIVHSVDEWIKYDDLSFEEMNILKQKVVSLFNQLKNSIFVCVSGDIKVFDSDYSLFINSIKQGVSTLGCTFTSQSSNADWIIRLQGTTREYNQLHAKDFTAYFVFAEVSLQITKGINSNIIYEGVHTAKGSHTLNREEAAYDAYKELSKSITQQIKEIINH